MAKIHIYILMAKKKYRKVQNECSDLSETNPKIIVSDTNCAVFLSETIHFATENDKM